MPREPMPTPVEPFSSMLPADFQNPDYFKGVVYRLDATVGRRPGALGPGDEGSGMAKAFYEHRDATRQLLGRMPGTNGVDDEGEGIARHVFQQVALQKQGRAQAKAALIGAAAAVMMSIATLITHYADTRFPVQSLPIQIPVQAASR